MRRHGNATPRGGANGLAAILAPMKSRALSLTRSLLPFRRMRRPAFTPDSLPAIPVPAEAIRVLESPAQFRATLLDAIAQAERRILLVTLYLQNDEAGREVLEALHQARRRNPALEITVLVDWHRAQRGLIGKGKSEGNAALYREYAERFGAGVAIYGVPVQNRELFGVLHLKGFVIDDTVIYSGASINDVYLARHGRYRLDRYHQFEHAALADCLVDFAQRELIARAAVCRLDSAQVPSTRHQLGAIRQFRQHLQSANYRFQARERAPGEIAITPLAGFGRGDNPLNKTLLELIATTERKLVVLTPYFNLPRPVRLAITSLLRQGREVTFVVGDKTANDFFIPPSETFKTIGLLPYLYEANLRRYAKTHARDIAAGRLNIYLWRDGDNSYHLKGLFIDDTISVVTGNNLNPRAWMLDLENALVLRDPEKLLYAKNQAELAAVLRHAHRLADFHALETPRQYPEPVRRLFKRLNRVRADRLVNRLL